MLRLPPTVHFSRAKVIPRGMRKNDGTTWLRGKVNEPANVTINGQNARVYADGTFESLTQVGPGVQDVAMQATDAAGNTTSQT